MYLSQSLRYYFVVRMTCTFQNGSSDITMTALRGLPLRGASATTAQLLQTCQEVQSQVNKEDGVTSEQRRWYVILSPKQNFNPTQAGFVSIKKYASEKRDMQRDLQIKKKRTGERLLSQRVFYWYKSSLSRSTRTNSVATRANGTKPRS